ncbi:MAG: insulinase family protein [Defluviitaleaceae bacterium]|nr:insulinase family protein [Defluviitaleaceae bacterium]
MSSYNSNANHPSLHFIHSAKFKTAIFCALLHRPLARDEVTRNALLPGILKRGCAKYPSIQSMRLAAEDLYGSAFDARVVKKGERQVIEFFFEAVPGQKDGNFYKGLEFMGECLLRPLEKDGAFLPEIVDGEKENLRLGIAARINSKAEYARFKCLEKMCEGEPFGIPVDGYAEDLYGLTGESLLEGWKNALAGSVIDFFCIGNLDEAELGAKVREIFSFPRSETAAIPAGEIKAAPGGIKTIKEEADATQGKLCMGLRCGVEPAGRRFYALMLANEIIGGGASSRLFANIREKNSMCYSVSSNLYRFKSIMLIQSGVSSDKLEEAAGMITEEIEKIKSGGISQEDLDNAKTALTKKYRGLQDYPAAALDYYASQAMIGDTDSLEDAVKILGDMSLGDVFDSLKSLAVDTVFLLAGKDQGQEQNGKEAAQ